MASISSKSTWLCCHKPVLLPLSRALLVVFRQLGPLIIVHETQYGAAQFLVAFSHLKSIGWSAIASANPSNVSSVYYDLKSGVATTPLLPSMLYVVRPTLIFVTASCPAHDYLVTKIVSQSPFGSLMAPYLPSKLSSSIWFRRFYHLLLSLLVLPCRSCRCLLCFKPAWRVILFMSRRSRRLW